MKIQKLSVFYLTPGLLFGTLTSIYPVTLSPRDPLLTIRTYDKKKDGADIANLFKKEWALLHTTSFNPRLVNHMIHTGSPDFSKRYFGKMTFDVAHSNNQFAGFISHYIKHKGVGHILFLAIEPQFRGKRYAQELLISSFHTLLSQGVQKITLITKIKNKRAQKLYERIGFTETGRHAGHVYYAMTRATAQEIIAAHSISL